MSLLVAYEQAYSECAVKWQLKFQDPTGEKAEQGVFSWLQEQRGLMASEKGRNEYLVCALNEYHQGVSLTKAPSNKSCGMWRIFRVSSNSTSQPRSN